MKAISTNEAQDVLRRTEEIEAHKSARQKEREEKKRKKAEAEKRAVTEKLIAPILLILTIFISLIVWLL